MSGATRRSGSTPSARKSSPSSTKPDPARQAAGLARELKAAGDASRAVQEKRYLKSELVFYGCRLAAIRSAVHRVKRAQPDLNVAGLRRLVRTLWKDPVFEHRITAVMPLDSFGGPLTPADVTLIERFLRDSKTWALVNELAGVVADSLVERYSKLNRTLDRWAVGEDFWLRRSALLALCHRCAAVVATG